LHSVSGIEDLIDCVARRRVEGDEEDSGSTDVLGAPIADGGSPSATTASASYRVGALL
jgi:hypothetical protein